MSLNCLEIEEIVNSVMIGQARFKRAYQGDKNSLTLSFQLENRDIQLVINTVSGLNRLYFDKSHLPRKNKTPGRFSEIINSELYSARLLSIRQINLNRIVLIEMMVFERKMFIAARLHGASANILLLDADFIIIDALRRYSAKGEWPGEQFVLPEHSVEWQAGLRSSVAPDNPLVRKYAIRPEFIGTDINLAVRDYFNSIESRQIYERKRDALIEKLSRLLGGINSSIKNASQFLNNENQAIYLKYGELIKNNIYNIKQGLSFVECFDYEADSLIRVPLRSELTPIENSKRYFEKYKKIKDGRFKWEQELAGLKVRSEELEKLLRFAKDAGRIDEINNIDQSISSKKNEKLTENRVRSPGKVYEIAGGYMAVVSRSAKEADEILSRSVRGNDFWFHIRDNAGSHVIVRYQNSDELPYNTMIDGALLAHYFSKSRSEKETDIYYTRVKYLKKTGGGKAGLVLPTFEKNIKSVMDIDRINIITG